MGGGGIPRGLAALGLPLAVLSAVYTGYLFAQAKARDLWQNPLLPPHFLIQSLLAGSAATALVAARIEPNAVEPLLWILAGASLLHLAFVAGEATLPHATAHARLAVNEMVAGRHRLVFWVGGVLGLTGLGAPWLGVWTGVPALAGLLLYEHAYVQAGQSVPLA